MRGRGGSQVHRRGGSTVPRGFIRSHTAGGTRATLTLSPPAGSRLGVTPALLMPSNLAPSRCSHGSRRSSPLPAPGRQMASLRQASGTRRCLRVPGRSHTLSTAPAPAPADTDASAKPSQPTPSPQDPRQGGEILPPIVPEDLPLSVRPCLYHDLRGLLIWLSWLREAKRPPSEDESHSPWPGSWIPTGRAPAYPLHRPFPGPKQAKPPPQGLHTRSVPLRRSVSSASNKYLTHPQGASWRRPLPQRGISSLIPP